MGPITIHCHILDHEDLGMMMVVNVVPQGLLFRISNLKRKPGPNRVLFLLAKPWNSLSRTFYGKNRVYVSHESGPNHSLALPSYCRYLIHPKSLLQVLLIIALTIQKHRHTAMVDE